MTPDVNVLVAAHRPEHPHHATALAWLRTAMERATRQLPVTLLPTVAVGYVRVVTDSRVFPQPTSYDEALGNVDALRASPNVRCALQGDEWPIFDALCRKHAIAGRTITDAWIAASVLHLGEHLVTFDRGFRRLLPARHLTILES